MASELVEELVVSAKPEEEKTKPSTPKRNSKSELIQKIVQLAKEVNEPLESDSQLKRMSKRVLHEKLAALVERRIEFEAQKCLGIDAEQAKSPYMVNLAALKMVHSIAVSSTETLVERTSDKHGMSIAGFKTKMQDCQESVDMILAEIAQQYPEVLENFSSPWVRLGLLWTSNVMMSLKKKAPLTNAPKIRPRPDSRVHTV